jgi:hypothetical protein
MTDIDPAALRSGELARVTGTIVHVNVFTQPLAGRTPIASEATTATMRVLIVNDGQAGFYSGGAFARVSGEPAKDANISASISGGTLMLTHATKGFSDQLGPSLVRTGLRAKRDDELARVLSRALHAVSGACEPVASQ